MKLSASSLERAFACPGSVFAEQGFAYTASPFAEEGNFLHRAMAGGLTLEEKLTREQQRLISICKDSGKDLRDAEFAGPHDWCQERYLKWSSTDPAGSISAKLDYAAWTEDVALIIDWKFGRGAVESADVNYQLRAYAVALHHDVPTLERITVAIVQPYEERGRRVHSAIYHKEDLEKSEAEFRGLFRVLNGMEAKPETQYRNPGDHCRYCKALGTARCPESAETARGLALIPTGGVMPTGTELAGWLDRCEVAEEVVSVLREHAKAELEAGREVPGWTLKPGRNVRQIPDAVEAWGKLDGIVSAEAFQTACKVTVGALEDAYAKATGVRGKEVAPALQAALGAALTMRKDPPTLARVK